MKIKKAAERAASLLEAGGLPCDVDAALPMPIRGLRAEAYQQGQAVCDSDFMNSPWVAFMPPGHVDLNNVMLAPLNIEEKTVGIMGLANKPTDFNEEDRRMAGALGQLVALALNNSRNITALKDSEARFRSYVENASHGVFIVDEHGRYTDLNPVACDITGCCRDELLQMSILDLVPPEGRSAGAAHFQRLMETGKASADLLLLTKAGAVRHWSVDSVRLSETRFERKRLHERQAQTDRLSSMGTLAAGVAHEINTPLSYVLYNLESIGEELPALIQTFRQSQAMSEQHPPGERLKSLEPACNPELWQDILERFKDALEGAQRIRGISRGLNTFSRVDSAETMPVKLENAVEAACSMANNELRHRARLFRDLGPTSAVLASEGRLAQVFLNLLINATHAIEEGDVTGNRIGVRTWEEEEWVYGQVEDSGRGIPLDDQDKTFDSFFTTKEVGEGSGLGLAISKSIIESYGGTIEVESKVDRGSRFIIRLPAVVAVLLRHGAARLAPGDPPLAG